MRKYLKYILMGILAVTLSSIFFKKKTEAETSLPRDYAEIAASGILRAVTAVSYTHLTQPTNSRV